MINPVKNPLKDEVLTMKTTIEIDREKYPIIKKIIIATHMSLNKFILEATKHFLKAGAKGIKPTIQTKQKCQQICIYPDDDLLYQVKKQAIKETARLGMVITTSDIFRLAIDSFCKEVTKKYKKEIAEVNISIERPAKYLQMRVSHPMIKEPSPTYIRARVEPNVKQYALTLSKRQHDLLHQEAKQKNCSANYLLKFIVERTPFKDIKMPKERYNTPTPLLLDKAVRERILMMAQSQTIKRGKGVSANDIVRNLVELHYFKKKK